MNTIAFHGSDYKFDEFSFVNMGKAHGLDAGFGMYFSESRADAATYGRYVYECYIELQHEVSLYKVTFQPQLLERMLTEWDAIARDKFFVHYGVELESVERRLKRVNELIAQSTSDVDLIKRVAKKTCDYNKDIWKLLSLLARHGYTHTVDTTTPELANVKHYIVYNLDNITIIKREKI